jgi:uncharacterized protein (DUF2141 family)
MKRINAIFWGLIMISNLTFSQIRLDIEIVEIRNSTGNIILQLFDEKEQVIYSETSTIKDNKCTVSVKNLAAGKYAVRYYHDENLNNKMETNMFGKPTEGTGFSNNVTEKFGPPPFEKWLFGIRTDTTIVLKPTY